MTTSPRPRAVLFDMDGTLVDSTHAVEIVWREFADRHGVDAAELLSLAHGVRAADTMTRYLALDEVSAAVELHEDREVELIEGVVAIPGAADYLRALEAAGIPVAIVTSASRRLAEVRLTAAGLTLPTVVITAEDVAAGKPSPDGYLLAAERLGVDPADCVVYEDAEAGIGAGLAAGAQVVVVGEHRSALTEGLDRVRDFIGLAAPGEGFDPSR